jgi:hypothetical protein
MARFTKARIVTVAVASAAATTLAGGIAYAFWTTSGSGSAAAQAGTASGVTAQTGAISVVGGSLLYPGSGVSAVINVHNPNSFPVTITGVTLTASTSPTITGAAGTCTTHAVALVAGTYAVATNTIAANSDGAVATTTNAITMGVNSDDGCRNAIFTFTIAGTSIASHNA